MSQFATAVNTAPSATVNTMPSATAVNVPSTTAVNTVPFATAVNTVPSATAVNTMPSTTAVNTMPSVTAVNTMPSATAVNNVPSIAAVNTVPSTIAINTMVSGPATAIGGLLGTNVGTGGTEWYFPFNMSQSTIDNRNGSNACVFIAFNFGLLYQQYGLDNTMVRHTLDICWQAALEHAIRAGNAIHDQYFDQDGVNVTVQEGIDLAGNSS